MGMKLGQKAKAPVDMAALRERMSKQMSHTETLKKSVIGLVGPVKQGKSVCAASISEFFPEELATGAPLVSLEDTYWLGFDRAATDGFAELGFTVPQVDLSFGGKDIYEYKQNIARAIKEVKQYVDAGIVKNVIVDTVSSFDFVIMKHLMDQYEGQTNLIPMWTELKSSHLNLWHQISSLDARIVCIFHTKARMELVGKKPGEAEAAEAKKLADSIDPNAPLEIAVTGQAKKLWMGQTSLLCPVVRERKGKRPYEYYLHLDSAKGIQGASRFNVGLDSKQPAHLGKLIKAIQANQPAFN